MPDINGLTQIAAAEKIGLSLSGMKSRIQRGREKLKEEFLKCCTFKKKSPWRGDGLQP